MFPFGHLSPGIIGIVGTVTPFGAKLHRSSLELVLLHGDSPQAASAGRRSTEGSDQGCFRRHPAPREPGVPGIRPRPMLDLPPVISSISRRKVACPDLPSRGHKVPVYLHHSSAYPFPHCTIVRRGNHSHRRRHRLLARPLPLRASRTRLPLVFSSK